MNPQPEAFTPISERGMSWRYWGVQVLVHLVLPLLILKLIRRSRKEPEHLSGLSERLGGGKASIPNAVWIYAASVGETRAASPLVKRLRAAGYSVVLTSQSPAGKAEGRRLFPDDPGIVHCFIPLDVFWAMRRFLKRSRPLALIVMEIEIWPAMLVEADRFGIPLVLANANLHRKSMQKQGALRRYILSLYRIFTTVYTRTADFKARYIEVGVDPDRIEVVGDMKYDQIIEPHHVDFGKSLRRGWQGVDRILFVASSVEGEEPELLNMVQNLLERDSALGVVWAPRSPQRFDAVTHGLEQKGLPVWRRSDTSDLKSADTNGARVLVGDSIGEMDIWYEMADLVFVGASLIDHGGHNIIEPLSHGKPVVMGPSTYGISFAADLASEAGAFESCPDAASLEATISQILFSDEYRQAMSDSASSFAATHTGASVRTFDSLQEGPLKAVT